MITGFRTEPTQDVDAMWEADAAAEWERLNEPDPDEDKLKDAADDFVTAYEHMCEAVQALYDAYKTVEGTIAEDKVASMMNDVEDLATEVSIMKNHLKEGEI